MTDSKGQAKSRHSYQLTVGRELSQGELDQLKTMADVHEVKKTNDPRHG